MFFNKAYISLTLLTVFFSNISGMDSPTFKRKRSTAPQAPRKKQRVESRLNRPQVSLFHVRLQEAERQDSLLYTTAQGTADGISVCLSDATDSDIHAQVLENIFSSNQNLTELEKINIYQQLNDLGVDLNAPVTLKDRNLLHIAAHNNEPELVKYILGHSSINPNSRSGYLDNKWSAVHFTASPQIISQLKKAGADVSASDIEGKTAADLITGDTLDDKKLKIYLATCGVFSQSLTEKQTEELATMTRHAVTQTMKTPLIQLLHNRQIGQEKRSFYNVNFVFDGIEKSNGSSDSHENSRAERANIPTINE